MTTPSKQERIAIFLDRLKDAPPASSRNGAYQLLVDTLNGVEDELTRIPNDPGSWASDGRLYPPLPDNEHTVPGRPELVKYRSRGHWTFIRDDGALMIEDLDGTCLLNKPAANGLSIR